MNSTPKSDACVVQDASVACAESDATTAVEEICETKTKRILVVEDDRSLNSALRMRLEINGYEVLSAYDGRSALEQSRASKPDLILLDVGLPDMNGLTAAQTLLSSMYTADIPILLITGDTSPNVVRFAAETGVRAVVHKPVRGKDLMEVVAANLPQK